MNGNVDAYIIVGRTKGALKIILQIFQLVNIQISK